jgi:hypothetical protein
VHLDGLRHRARVHRRACDGIASATSKHAWPLWPRRNGDVVLRTDLLERLKLILFVHFKFLGLGGDAAGTPFREGAERERRAER